MILRLVIGVWRVISTPLYQGKKEEGSLTGSITQRRGFGSFIEDMELVDVLVLGKKFSYFGKDGKSMSRIDRFLLSEGLVTRWGVKAKWIGDRDISDHCPAWLVYSELNWGPKPFRFNNC